MGGNRLTQVHVGKWPLKRSVFDETANFSNIHQRCSHKCFGKNVQTHIRKNDGEVERVIARCSWPETFETPCTEA